MFLDESTTIASIIAAPRTAARSAMARSRRGLLKHCFLIPTVQSRRTSIFRPRAKRPFASHYSHLYIHGRPQEIYQRGREIKRQKVY